MVDQQDDVKLKLRIDTDGAKRDMGRFRNTLESTRRTIGALAGAGGRAAQAGLAGLATGIFGSLANQARSTLLTQLNRLGEATPIGRIVTAQAARVTGEERAFEETARIFGPHGRDASPEAIRNVFNILKRQFVDENEGMLRVRQVVRQEQANEQLQNLWSDAIFAMENLGAVLTSLVSVVQGKTGAGIIHR